MLTAKFTAKTYKITYKDVPSGVSNPNPTTYTYGKAVTLKEISQSGYKFDGWYDSNNKVVTSIPSTSTGDIVLTAKFTKSDTKKNNTDDNKTDNQNNNNNDSTNNNNNNTKAITYKITYKGVTSVTIKITNPNPSTYTVGKGLTFKNATATGYTFLGWYTSSGIKVTKLSTKQTGNITVIAKWQKTTTIKPANIKNFKVTKKKKYKLVSYSKLNNVAGYHIQYTLNKKVKNIKTTATSKKLNKKATKIRVRSIVKSNGKFVYGAWTSYK